MNNYIHENLMTIILCLIFVKIVCYLSGYASLGPRPAHSTESKRAGTENRIPESS